MRADARALLMAFVLCATPRAEAGTRTAETQTAAMPDAAVPKLALAGCATRRVLLFSLYDLRLYLPQRTATAAAAFDPKLPKFMELQVTYPGNVPGDLPGSWRKRFEERHLPPALIADLERLYQNLAGGDVLSIDYRPGRGSLVRLNGATQTADHGTDLMDSLLDIWMGPRALHPEMRTQLLSGTCR